MDLNLTKQNLIVQQIANEFSKKTLNRIVMEMGRNKSFTHKLAVEMGKLGWLSIVLYEKYGGKDFDYVSTALAYEEVGAVCSSIRVILTVQIGLVGMCILDCAKD